METILFSAELGSGFGHVKRLLPIANAAARAGYRPVFLVINPDEAAAILGDCGFEVRLSPLVAFTERSRPGGVATSYADILGSAGFQDRDGLGRAVAAWDAALAEIRPRAVVAEMSPFLNLAAYGGEVPLLVVGHGFALPPPHLAAFPRLWDGPPLYDEAALLDNVAAVCRARGRAAPAALPALLEGHAHAVTGLEALDPYREQRRQPAVGPPAVDARLADRAPTEDLFAYLGAEVPTTMAILRVLAASGVRGRAFVRRGTRAHREALTGSGMAFLDRPVPIREALDDARVILHHGTMLTSEEALAAGRPQLVAPHYLEHLFTARALGALGVARVLRPSFSAWQITELVASVLADGGLADRARAQAERFWQTAPPPVDLPRRLFEAVVPG